MKFNYKQRKTLKQVLSILLCGLVIFGAVFGVSALSSKLKEDTKVIRPTFSVGGIDINGVGNSKSTSSIYTKEAFEAQGLSVKLDFDAYVKYQAFFYDDLDNYISSSEIYSVSSEVALPSGVTRVRLVVYPIWDGNVDKKDRVCHWYDVYKYSKQLEIRVLKEQNNKKDIVEDLTFTVLGYKKNYADTLGAPAVSASNYMSTKDALSVVDTTEFEICVPAGGVCGYIFYDESGNSLTNIEAKVDGTSKATTETVKVPDNAMYVHFNFSLEKVASVYDYQIFKR